MPIPEDAQAGAVCYPNDPVSGDAWDAQKLGTVEAGISASAVESEGITATAHAIAVQVVLGFGQGEASARYRPPSPAYKAFLRSRRTGGRGR